MPTPWLAWTRLPCKSDKVQVHDPKCNIPRLECHPSSSIISTRSQKFSFSKSFSTLRDVVNGNSRVAHKSSSSLKDERGVCYKDGREEASIVRHGRQKKLLGMNGRGASAREYAGSDSVSHVRAPSRRKLSGCSGCDVIQDSASCRMVYVDLPRQRSFIHYQMQLFCPSCGQIFGGFEALEQHHVAFHAVTELRQGDSSRNIVEIIFKTSWLKKDLTFDRIERILKIQNSQRTIARFEEYRDIVKSRAAIQGSSHTRKHARCLADGNELLRFHATTLQCSLRSNSNSSSSLCTISSCKVCSIIRSGFSFKKDVKRGIYTTATSGRAHASLLLSGQNLSSAKLAMLVCRVIAGRMYKGYDSFTSIEFGPPEGYESVSGEVSPYANVDDLHVFSPRAVLPCFVVIYKC